MLATFSSLSPHLKFKTKVISVDNLAFKFHYRATLIILLVCTLLVTSRQYIGEHIRCITGGSIPDHVINTFCFFTTTFTVIRHYNETLLHDGVLPHPGVGPMLPDDPVKFHAYYQWVPFVLFIQAMMFYLPHFIWRNWEGGKIKALVIGLQMISLSKNYKQKENMVINTNYSVLAKPVIDGRLANIKTAFYQHVRVNRHWASRFMFCEFMNLGNLLLQIYFTDVFLGGQFYNLGINFMQDDFTGDMDALDTVFPKVTKCHFHKYGPSGSIQKHDALCVMALNVINEKIYTFLWFWYIFLLFVTTMALIWRIITVVMHSRSTKFNGFVFSFACPGRLNPWDMLVVTQQFAYSDWLFLYYLAKNMEPYLFRDMLVDLAKELRDAKEKKQKIEDNISDSDNETHQELLHADINEKANIENAKGKHVNFA